MTLKNNGGIAEVTPGSDVNNHIHTTFSFSPYSPTLALTMAHDAGLSTAGIMDHDSIGGAAEFVAAGEILGMTTTVGVECRVSVEGTPLAGRRLNNPDQISVAYMALHGIPHTQFDRVREFFAPYIEARLVRNRKMTDNINALIASSGIKLDFDRDVLSISEYKNGGTVTERHLLFALSQRITHSFGHGAGCVDFLKNKLNIPVSAKAETLLTDADNPHYEYDLLGVLKSDMVEKFYIPATDECPKVRDILALSKEISAVAAYAYLGDVGSSVTGDKKAQTFEDSFIELLFETISELGYNAVTYMPSRNTQEQLDRVMALCDKHGLFQISGEDINSPRQKFICEKQRDAAFAHLNDATWALIGHERAATEALENGMFSEKTIKSYPALAERIKLYSKIGRGVQTAV